MSLRSTIRQIQARDKDLSAINSDKAAFINEWRSDLEKMFDIIAKELSEYIQDGLLELSMSHVDVKEDGLGNYSAPLLKIKAGSKDVVARPIARITTGGAGRVDLMRADRTTDRDRIYIVRRVEESGNLQWYIEDKKIDPLEAVMPFVSQILQSRSYEPMWNESLEKAIDFLLQL